MSGDKDHKGNKHDHIATYKVKCKDCPQYYIGQTVRTFSARYKEHSRNTGSNKDNTRFAQHVLGTRHTRDHKETMQIIQIIKNGQKYHIYKANRRNTNE
jgi:hypothetical protein